MKKTSDGFYWQILAVATFIVLFFSNLTEAKAVTVDFIANYVIVEIDPETRYIVDVSKELSLNDKEAIMKKVRNVLCKENSRYCDN